MPADRRSGLRRQVDAGRAINGVLVAQSPPASILPRFFETGVTRTTTFVLEPYPL